MKDTLPTKGDSDIKNDIRRETLAKRDAIPLPVRRLKDSAIKDRLMGIDAFKNAGTILFYASFRSEVSTMPIIEEAIRMGKAVCLPKSEPETLTLSVFRVRGPDDIKPGYMGIPEPAVSENAAGIGIEGIEMVIIPGSAFDPKGGRLGYGKGFYDRLLTGLKGSVPLLALAYEEQVVGEIPLEEHDVPVDMIITDRRIIDCVGQG